MFPIRADKSGRFFLSILLFAIALPASSTPVAAQQKKESAFKTFADGLNDAFDQLTGKKPKAVTRVAPARAMAAEEAAAEAIMREVGDQADQQMRRDRLTPYAAAVQSWVTIHAELTEDQIQLLSQSTNRLLEDGVKTKIARNNRNFANDQLSDVFPIRMTGSGGAATALDLTRLPSVLTELKLSASQSEKLEAAIDERKQFHADAVLQRILNILDRELFLSTTQRIELAKLIKPQINPLDQSFSFSPQDFYLRQTPIFPYIQGLKQLESVSKAQLDRVDDLRGLQNGQYIMFQSATSNAWDEQFAQAVKTQKQRLKRACEVRVAFYENESAIAASDLNRLSVAGKGAVEELITAWKPQARRQLDAQAENMARWAGQNVSFSIVAADANQIEQNSLWSETLESLAASQAETARIDRRARRQDAQAEFVVCMLDRELWLTKEQREQLVPVIRNQLADPDHKSTYTMYFEELEILAVQLAKCSKQDMAGLTKTQNAAFESLRKQFSFAGNTVSVVLPNGGQFNFAIPR